MTYNDQDIYLKAKKELDSNKREEALWIKALTLCQGDEKKAKYKYIELRVKSLSIDTSQPKEEPTSASPTRYDWLRITFLLGYPLMMIGGFIGFVTEGVKEPLKNTITWSGTLFDYEEGMTVSLLFILFIVALIWTFKKNSKKKKLLADKEIYPLKGKGDHVDGKEEGFWEFFNDHGQLMEAGNYKKGLRYGYWEFFNDHGQLSQKGSYNKKGKRFGLWVYFHDNGRVMARGRKKDGEDDGVWEYFDENGHTIGGGKHYLETRFRNLLKK